MRKRKIDSFTCFIGLLLFLVLFFFLKLVYGMQEEKQQYTALISLGEINYDQNFLKNASKIKGLQELWPVVEIPITIKIDDYTKTTVFNGIDLNAFTQVTNQEDLGNTPLLLLGSKALENMKDSNGHTISRKQQEKYLQMKENLKITYSLDSTNLENTISSNSSAINNNTNFSSSATPKESFFIKSNLAITTQTTYLPCQIAAILSQEDDQIYIPMSQVSSLCEKAGTQLNVTKVLLKITGKDNLENARHLFE